MSTDPNRTFQPKLKLWQPVLFDPTPEPKSGGNRPSLWPGMSLSLFYRTFVRPYRLEGMVDAKTIGDYELAIASWIEFTGDPPMDEVGEEHKSLWRIGCQAKKGRRRGEKGAKFSYSSIKKYAGYLNACFRAAGPYSPHCEHAQELLTRAPRLRESPGSPPETKDSFTMIEIEGLLASCYTANVHWPKLDGVAIGDWWMSRILGAFYTGERRDAMHRACYRDIKGEMLTFRAKTRKRRQKSLTAWLHPELLRMIEQIRTPRELIWEFRTYGRNKVYHWPSNAGSFEDAFRAICREAGIPDERQFGIHGIRRSLATALTEAGHPWEAQQALGHSDSAVTDMYRNPQLVAKAVRALPALKIPARSIAV